MRQACREVPKIALLHVGHLWTSILVQNCHAAVSVSHDGPFCLLVPVKLTNAPWAEAHVDARNRRRDFKVILSNLPRPTAVLDTLGSKIERSPILRHAVDVGRRWVEESGLVAGEVLVLRPGVG